MSPFLSTNSNVSMLTTNSVSSLVYFVISSSNTNYVVPVISIKSSAIIASGSGTYNSPYIIN